ncbi:MAG: hypothetical protein ACOCY6_05180, partial [Halodesulfurarchaeum sp.]
MVQDQAEPPQEPPAPQRSPALEAVETDPDQMYDTSGSAQRIIDEEFDVVKQNRVMEEWTGVSPDQQ